MHHVEVYGVQSSISTQSSNIPAMSCNSFIRCFHASKEAADVSPALELLWNLAKGFQGMYEMGRVRFYRRQDAPELFL